MNTLPKFTSDLAVFVEPRPRCSGSFWELVDRLLQHGSEPVTFSLGDRFSRE
jgi:hypothetical protein